MHRWLPAALLLGAAPALTAALLTGSFDLQAAERQVSALGGPLAVVGFALFTDPLSEELGWRGYAQPGCGARPLSPPGCDRSGVQHCTESMNPSGAWP